MRKLEGAERDTYIESIAGIVANRCYAADITHPEDVANQFVMVAEIIGAFTASEEKA